MGRWVWDLETGLCELDEVSLALFGRLDRPDALSIDAFLDIVHADDRAAVQSAADEAMAGGADYSADFRIRRQSGDYVWIRGSGTVARLDDGRRVLLGANVDISELRESQEELALLAGEMAHKVGNLLSLVSGLYRLAARRADTVDALSEAFLGRIGALSRVTQLSLRSPEHGMEAADLVSLVLAELSASEQVSVRVDPVALNPAAAQTITLALNELLTNAVKHGALREPDGRLEIDIATDSGADNFTLSWREQVRFPVVTPCDQGSFGMTVLNRMTAATLRGRPRFDWRDTGMHFSCEWPLSAVVA